MKKLICILMLLIIVFSSGCVEKKEVIKGRERDYLVYNLDEFPKDLLMLDNDSIREKDLLLALFEGLVREDEYGGILPGLAKNWTISNDGLHYTFNIREDAYWSDGEKIHAEDFVEFFSAILNVEMDNVFSNQLNCVYGANDYKKGIINFNEVAIEAVDKETLHIGLNKPSPYFLSVLCQPYFTLRKVNTDIYKWQDYYKTIQYSGAFTIDKLKKNDKLLLCKNENYWRNDEVMSENILITSIKSKETALIKFESNDIDCIDIFVEPPLNERDRLMSIDELLIIPSTRDLSLNFNMKKEGIIYNENFRKALSCVIAKEYIINNISQESAVSASTYIPSIVNNYMFNLYDKKEYFDIYSNNKKAEEYFSKCRFDKNKSVKLVYKKSYLNKKICEAIALNIKEALEINVITKGYDEVEIKEVLKKGDYDIIQMDYLGEYDDVMTYYERWTSKSQFNKYGYSNLEYDKKILEASIVKNKFERNKILEEGRKILISDMPSIPIYFFNTVVCKKKYIDGLYVTKKGNIKLDKVYKSSR